MKLKAINLHDAAKAGLDELAGITGLSTSELMRRALDAYLTLEFTKMNKPFPVDQRVATA